jgi:hypothetical protein
VSIKFSVFQVQQCCAGFYGPDCLGEYCLHVHTDESRVEIVVFLKINSRLKQIYALSLVKDI